MTSSALETSTGVPAAAPQCLVIASGISSIDHAFSEVQVKPNRTAPFRPTRRQFLARCGATATLGALTLSACTSGERASLAAPPTATIAPTSGVTSTPAPATPTARPTLQPTAQPTTQPTIAAPPPSPRPSATATAAALGKLNDLRVDGTRIVDASGQEVTLTGLNWFGMETGTLAPHGLWARSYQDMLDQIVQAGYNCLRLPFSNALFDPGRQPNGIDFSKNPDLKGLSGLQILDTIVVAAGTRGLKIILDQHRPDTEHQSQLWYTDKLSEASWIDQWRALAERYRGNDAVIGADLHNEPSGPSTWGSGDLKTDWAIAAETCGNAILAVNPSWLILVEGVEKVVDHDGNPKDWTWQGGELMQAATRPIKLKLPNRLVYSPHDYGPGVYGQRWFTDPSFPENLPGFWDEHWGYLQERGTAPVLLGEFGGRSVGNDAEGKWQRALLSYLKTNRMHYTYWCLNPNSGDTGGLLKDDWQTIDAAKQDLLQSYQGKLLKNNSPKVVNVEAVPPPPHG